MKRTATLLLTLILLAVGAGTVWASNGDTLNIGGQVPLVLTLTVVADANADNLTLITTGVDVAATATIASIDITTNNSAGWELWVFSANADATDTGMINADGDEIEYSINYSGLGTPGVTDIDSDGVLVGEDAANAAQTGETLTIGYTQSESYPAGYYSDQLSIVLRAK